MAEIQQDGPDNAGPDLQDETPSSDVNGNEEEVDDEADGDEEESGGSESELDLALEDYQNLRDVTPPVDVPSSVLDAVKFATADRVQGLLIQIIATLSAAKAIAARELLVPIPGASKELKRKAYEECKNCSREYRVEGNHKGDCVYHDGFKDVDYDSHTWADHDERCHGDPERLKDDPGYRQGFIWDCCDQAGDSEGCVVSKHQPKVPSVKRPALMPLSGNGTASRPWML